ncbi:MAG: FHA domain-containing protein [Actinobacteria bacterium]|nr:FHA domain-containing protein [Actinomycetota bacterium]MBU1607921.1 FHA domain-containing protein [Actinomycetota bacterium]MBU2316097.1 FHA domain-containing protein [Actinomycetota bacterium]MBU2386045.1 FHA domain-containing protein [Actinomycetota bacterium]
MKPMGMLVATGGGILLAVGFIWGWVIGYYDYEAPMVFGSLAAGALLLFIGSRMIASTKPTTVEWHPTAEAARAAQATPVGGTASGTAPTSPTTPPADDPEEVSDPVERIETRQREELALSAPLAGDTAPDETVAVARRPRRAEWHLELPDGSTVSLTREAILGRAPELTSTRPDAETVIIDDPSVSKSHAAIRVVDRELQVRDLGSANGTVVLVGGVEKECPSNTWMPVPDGAVIELGAAPILCTVTMRREVTS